MRRSSLRAALGAALIVVFSLFTSQPMPSYARPIPSDAIAAHHWSVATDPEPSDLDTLRFESTYAYTGDSFFVELYVANVDTLGAYNLRAVFDPAVIEPLTDTSIFGNDTTIWADVILLRGDAFEEYGGGVPEPGVLLFSALDFDADTSSLFLPGSGVAVRFGWRVLPGAVPQVAPLIFENDPVFPQSWNTMVDLHGIIFKRPVLMDGTVTIIQPCECPFQGDLDGSGFFDAIDLNALIDIVFFGGFNLQDPDCPTARSDWNCDGFPDAIDLNAAIEHVFFGGPLPCNLCP